MVARNDLVSDPSTIYGLLLARRGEAYYSRKLSELSDADLDRPSLLPGWSRRDLIAHVGLNARAITRLLSWAATGVETPMYDSPTQRIAEIELSATLPAQALRNLNDHAAIHLSVEWRDLPDAAWSREVQTAEGQIVPARETVWMRAREVWIHAIDLDNGARFEDFPPDLLDALLVDAKEAWDHRRGDEPIPSVILEVTDRPGTRVVSQLGSPTTRSGLAAIELSGTSASLVAWATGRDKAGVTNIGQTGVVADAPPWL